MSKQSLSMIQRIAPTKMAKIFSGLHVAFAELSNDSKARILFTKKVESGGGSVMVARPGAFFGSKGAGVNLVRYRIQNFHKSQTSNSDGCVWARSLMHLSVVLAGLDIFNL